MSIKYNIRYTGGFQGKVLVKENPIDEVLNLKEKMLQPTQKELTDKEYSYKIIKCLRIFYDINNVDLDYIADDILGLYFKDFIMRASYIPERYKLEVINFIKSSEEEMIEMRDKLISSNIEEIALENGKIKILRKGEEVMIGGSWWYDYLLPLFIGVGIFHFFTGYYVGKGKKDKFNRLFFSLGKILDDQGYNEEKVRSFISRNWTNIELLYDGLPENPSSEEFKERVLKLINDDKVAEEEAQEKRRQEEAKAEEMMRQENLDSLLADEIKKEEKAKRKKAKEETEKAARQKAKEEAEKAARQRAKEEAEKAKQEKAIRDFRSLVRNISNKAVTKSLEDVGKLLTNIKIRPSSPPKQNDTPYVVENIPTELLQIIITQKVFGIIFNLDNEFLQINSSEITSKMWKQFMNQNPKNDFEVSIPKAWNFTFDEKIVPKTQNKRIEGSTSPINFKPVLSVPNYTFSFKVKLPIKTELEEINFLPRVLDDILEIRDYSYRSWPQAFYPLTSEDLNFKPDEQGKISFYKTFKEAEDQSFEFLYDASYKFKISIICSINDESENILIQDYNKVAEKEIIPTEILVRIIKIDN